MTQTDTHPQQTATEISNHRWFGKPEIVANNELDLDALISEFEEDPEFLEIQKETFTAVGNCLLSEGITLDGLRLRAGLSQKQLAEKMNSTQPYIARLEKGEVKNPGVNHVIGLAEALEASLEEVASVFREKP